tara:strand:+ start:75 stop:767 length:693 start_codon:yes stop_codon:yes gene_type:complete
MYPYHSDAYPQKGTLLDIIQNFLSGRKATIESIKDPYGISDMDDPVIPSFVTKDTPVPPAKFPQRFDNTLAGQYQRYFKTPEFDSVFGAGARGTGAPQDAAAMEVLGNQIEAPEEDTNIASMYAAQSAMGRVNQDKIQDYFADTNLPGNVKLKDGSTALQAWAKENPMLAQREYLKAQAKFAENAPMAPDGETVMGDLGSRAQMENPMGQEAYDAIMAAKEKLMKKAGSK